MLVLTRDVPPPILAFFGVLALSSSPLFFFGFFFLGDACSFSCGWLSLSSCSNQYSALSSVIVLPSQCKIASGNTPDFLRADLSPGEALVRIPRLWASFPFLWKFVYISPLMNVTNFSIPSFNGAHVDVLQSEPSQSPHRFRRRIRDTSFELPRQ